MKGALLGLASAFAVISPSLSEPQPAARVVRIGWLSGASEEWSAPYLNALRGRLSELGYSQTQIVVEARHANDRSDVLPRLAAELVRAKVDVIIAASSTPATQAAKQATTTIPIVMVGAGEPVRTGVVASLARPGGNVTGSTVIGPEIAAKRLQLVRELFPTAAEVALLWNPDNASNAKLHEELRVASRSFGVRLQSVEVSHPERFESSAPSDGGEESSGLWLEEVEYGMAARDARAVRGLSRTVPGACLKVLPADRPHNP